MSHDFLTALIEYLDARDSYNATHPNDKPARERNALRVAEAEQELRRIVDEYNALRGFQP